MVRLAVQLKDVGREEYRIRLADFGWRRARLYETPIRLELDQLAGFLRLHHFSPSSVSG